MTTNIIENYLLEYVNKSNLFMHGICHLLTRNPSNVNSVEVGIVVRF